MGEKVVGTSYTLVRNDSMQVIKGLELNALMMLAPKLNRKLTPDEKRDLQNLLFIMITGAFELEE